MNISNFQYNEPAFENTRLIEGSYLIFNNWKNKRQYDNIIIHDTQTEWNDVEFLKEKI